MNSIEKARLKSNKTNSLKGIRTFIKSAISKQDKIHNEIIDDLINSGFYKFIYDKYINQNGIIENVDDKILSVFSLTNVCHPDDLSKLYKGFYTTRLF